MSVVWDVIVIGAGPAGCLVANHLNRRGVEVLLLDAGSFLQREQRITHPDLRIWPFTVVGDRFDWNRVRAVGGRAHLWGGWCHRFPPQTFSRGGWPVTYDTIEPFYRQVETYLNVRRGALGTRFEHVSQELGLTIHPKVRAEMENRQLWSPEQLPFTKNAQTQIAAMYFEHEGDAVERLVCFDLKNEELVYLRSRSFILATSPIETARLLLLSKLGSAGRHIGKGFVDHMVAGYVLLEPRAREAFKDPLSYSALVENFVNLDESSKRAYPGGFTIELSGPVSLESLNLERMVPESELDGWSATQIHAMGECFPYEHRYVDLDPSKMDMTGQAAPRIHVAWSAEEMILAEDLQLACTQLADALAIPGSKLVKFTDPLSFGAGHEAGTCAMGDDLSSPCDDQGRLRALKNVWVADASTMPTSGDRHPTLTVLAQGLRSAEDCFKWLKTTQATRVAIS